MRRSVHVHDRPLAKDDGPERCGRDLLVMVDGDVRDDVGAPAYLDPGLLSGEAERDLIARIGHPRRDDHDAAICG